jgi:hypothetical protein
MTIQYSCSHFSHANLDIVQGGDLAPSSVDKPDKVKKGKGKNENENDANTPNPPLF